MSLWSRFANLLRGDALNREIDEELQSHIEEAIEHGRDPAEARRAFGPALRRREESRDIRIVPWLDSLRADAVFGWRQLMKRKVTSAAAILSLALAIGSCTSAFRLIDATLLRPLPVAAPERLDVLSHESMGRDGKLYTGDACAYPMACGAGPRPGVGAIHRVAVLSSEGYGPGDAGDSVGGNCRGCFGGGAAGGDSCGAHRPGHDAAVGISCGARTLACSVHTRVNATCSEAGRRVWYVGLVTHCKSASHRRLKP
jgi:hypothetical protein